MSTAIVNGSLHIVPAESHLDYRLADPIAAAVLMRFLHEAPRETHVDEVRRLARRLTRAALESWKARGMPADMDSGLRAWLNTERNFAAVVQVVQIALTNGGHA